MDSSRAFDVAIIGAGPAGSTLAALLASRGASVLLADRDRFPRDKLCGEFLSYDALPVLRLTGALDEIDAAGAARIDRCRFAAARHAAEIELPHPARGISRLLLDDVLLRIAARRGAKRMDGWTVTSLEPAAGRLVLERNGEQQEIEARVIAGAWGRWGRFDTQLKRSFVGERRDRSFGFKRHYVSATLRNAESGAIELHPFWRGYLGVNQVEGGVTNVCGLVHADRLAGHKGRWDSFVETIRRERAPIDRLFEGLTPAQEGFLSSDPVVFRPRSPVEEGVFLVGDSSGVIDPLTGNGMAMAIQSALLAAPLLLRAAADRSARAEAEAAYLRAHAAFFGRRIRWSRAAALLLSRPRAFDLAVRALPARVGTLFLGRTRAPLDAVERLLEAWSAGS